MLFRLFTERMILKECFGSQSDFFRLPMNLVNATYMYALKKAIVEWLINVYAPSCSTYLLSSQPIFSLSTPSNHQSSFEAQDHRIFTVHTLRGACSDEPKC